MSCPHCNGRGKITVKDPSLPVIHTTRAGTVTPMKTIVCNPCKGTGQLTTPYVNPITARNNQFLADMQERNRRSQEEAQRNAMLAQQADAEATIARQNAAITQKNQQIAQLKAEHQKAKQQLAQMEKLGQQAQANYIELLKLCNSLADRLIALTS